MSLSLWKLILEVPFHPFCHILVIIKSLYLRGGDYSRFENLEVGTIKGISEAAYMVVSDSVTTWSVAHQTPLSMEFSRQEYWCGLQFPPPGDLPHPGIKPWCLALQADSLPFEVPGKLLKWCWW